MRKGISLSEILNRGHKRDHPYIVVNHGVLTSNRCKVLNQMHQTRVIMVVYYNDGFIFSSFLSHCFSYLNKAVDFSFLCK